MRDSTRFIYKHQAKLTWKMVKHGAGVLVGAEDREGSGSHKSDGRKTDHSEEFIEVPTDR